MAAMATVALRPDAVPLLRTVALTKSFDGLEAVRSVDFTLDAGEIRAIIGPNGAGKTTLVSMISGRITPTSGRVLHDGRDITSLAAHERAAIGLVYTFQISSIFRNLSVYENVVLAAQRRLMRSLAGLVTLDVRAVHERAEAALNDVGLTYGRDLEAGSLPYGHQRLLEVAMALALEPRVLILDEPTQGLAPDETAALAALIRKIAADVTVLLIEHNMQVVLDLSSRITVMDNGT
ncbi:MAG TPA: ABC transporter ATP-binding protein, partial [bacterium]|nr:ABC transporter ATP-binding protein [bacterium]